MEVSLPFVFLFQLCQADKKINEGEGITGQQLKLFLACLFDSTECLVGVLPQCKVTLSRLTYICLQVYILGSLYSSFHKTFLKGLWCSLYHSFNRFSNSPHHLTLRVLLFIFNSVFFLFFFEAPSSSPKALCLFLTAMQALYWLAFIVLGGVLHVIRESHHHPYSTANPGKYSSHQPGNTYSLIKWWHNVTGVTNLFRLDLRPIPQVEIHTWHCSMPRTCGQTCQRPQWRTCYYCSAKWAHY